MKENLVTILIAVISSGALTAIINNAAQAHRKESAKEVARDKAITFLLASSIRQECQEHINKGEINQEDLKRLEEAWAIYHDGMGGNGFLNTYMSDIRRLPKSKEN